MKKGCLVHTGGRGWSKKAFPEKIKRNRTSQVSLSMMCEHDRLYPTDRHLAERHTITCECFALKSYYSPNRYSRSRVPNSVLPFFKKGLLCEASLTDRFSGRCACEGAINLNTTAASTQFKTQQIGNHVRFETARKKPSPTCSPTFPSRVHVQSV